MKQEDDREARISNYDMDVEEGAIDYEKNKDNETNDDIAKVDDSVIMDDNEVKDRIIKEEMTDDDPMEDDNKDAIDKDTISEIMDSKIPISTTNNDAFDFTIDEPMLPVLKIRADGS